MIRRVFVEKRPAFRNDSLRKELARDLGVKGLTAVRSLSRYEVEGIDDETWRTARQGLFCEPATEEALDELEASGAAAVFAVEYLPGQFDQRADSAEQCLKVLADCTPVVRCAEVLVLEGTLAGGELERIKKWRINPVDSREADLAMPRTLLPELAPPPAVCRLEGFRNGEATFREALHAELGLAMSMADLAFCQQWFREKARREPTVTEIKLLDTYWSDHCRHTTFLTELTEVSFAEGPLTRPVKAAWEDYRRARADVYGEKAADRPVCLMDIALMGMKSLRAENRLPALEVSEEVNAASIVIPVDRDGREEEWLLMFKNETHNHPTEIEPFGGAATCLGGAIRDPLSGRSYVYQAMRVTGSGDPRQSLEDTLPGKLPQRKITTGAADGYSSYGNQIGLATGLVRELYHPGYVAKRLEIGAVIGAAPRRQVVRGTPEPGDVILLVGGRTGRDGIGGATGSSKAHSETALENAAEVQKGDPPTERKLQRLFRHAEVSSLIKRCNDFGAGGVSVAIGELAAGVEVDLDAVPLKYAGLDGTEIALSESQERMAVVIAEEGQEAFRAWAARENLEASVVARVTEAPVLRMRWRGDLIVEIEREFLDSNGVRQQATARVVHPENGRPGPAFPGKEDLAGQWKAVLADLNVCSQRGLSERFDSTVGGATVLHPHGGRERVTPPEAMAALLPVPEGGTTTATLMSFGFQPRLSHWSPFHGAVFAVVEAVGRIVASGGRREACWLTLQEYFERLREEPERWGKPLSALLGAWKAQRELGIAAIGGKDSMSGSFRDMDVPPTLVAFAVCVTRVDRILSPEFKGPDHAVVRVPVPLDDAGLPEWTSLRSHYRAVAEAVDRGGILSASCVGEGGVAAAISRMAFGNRHGFAFERPVTAEELFTPAYGDLLLELREGVDPSSLPGVVLGKTSGAEAISFNGHKLSLRELRAYWEGSLEGVFPTRPDEAGASGASIRSQLHEPHVPKKALQTVAKPRVLLPVFPGTNCEYESARAFREAGAEVMEMVVRNRGHGDVEESVRALTDGLGNAQILMLAGGFSAGDEPGGSGKFIASLFRHPGLSEAVHRLLHERDGLVLGICNGFQALVKLGLLPHGEIEPGPREGPSLTENSLGRHVSCYVRTKVVSRKSPWLSLSPLGAEYLTPVSHGEGRFIAEESVLEELFRNDQVATQYVDSSGNPTMEVPHNPNGSLHAIEGITSVCGRIFGRMGHTERTGPGVGINIPGEQQQPLFEAGVRYFTG
ncbi:MAG: phosphoribosylformylglycinamidine synthase [Verrucomicrobia bacterium]|jgi:phosphoribosylformylglycinamidine synthase|nr:phosphoribosylformylglycinamidine synthase [Verrucomicrobiota bacterium]